jgi:hypothetical protein
MEENGAESWHRFISVFIAARQIGLGVAGSYVLQSLSALIAVLGIIYLWRKPVPHQVRCAALVVGTFLATPYVMDYDLVVTAFVAVWLSQTRQNYKFAVGCLFLIPVLSTPLGKFAGVGMAPLMLLPACKLIWSSNGSKTK